MSTARKTLFTISIIAFVVLLAIGSVFVFRTRTQQSILGQEVWIPLYLTAECNVRADNLAEIQITSHTDSATWYHCTTQEAKKYVPLVNGIQCSYKLSDFSAADVQICDGVTSNNADLTNRDKCTADLSSTFGDVQSFTVNAGDSIYINADSFGTSKLFVRYPSWGLRIRTIDGFVQATTTSCLVNTIDTSRFHTVAAADRLEVVPMVPFNIVSGSVRARTNQAVSLSDVENGASIYITRPGFYNLIKTADDGFKYVDTRQEFSSAAIECIPRTTGCSDEAKVIKITEQSCSALSGVITGYAPVQGDSTKLCKYQCTSGKLQVTDSCIAVPRSCPSETPLWDAQTGKCTALLPPPVPVSGMENTLLYVVIGLLVVVIITMILTAPKKRGRRR